MRTLRTTPHKLKKIARIQDKATGKYLEIIEFPITKTKTSRIELSPSVINDRVNFERKLRDAGALLPKENDELKELLLGVAKSDAPEDWIYEARTGWTKNNSAFVLRDRLIGKSARKIIGVNQRNSINDPSGRLLSSGSWRAWRNTVAEPARLSSILMFVIGAALAAPLLAVIKHPSLTICLSGRTRTGKTIATFVGGSVIGVARSAEMITWNITDARFEERMSDFNDMLFPIDDLSNMKGGDAQKYSRIRDLAYRVSQGWSTARHSSFESARGGLHDSWRCIPLTSSEKPIRDLARSVKRERQYGEALRLLDVPVLFGGLNHIFDRLPKDSGGIILHDWKRETFKKIVDACEQNHGKAFKKYVKALIADRSNLDKYVRAKVAFFTQHMCDEYDGDVARDVAQKFGLIYAAGMLGIRCGLLPWDKSELLDAVSTCYTGARDLLPDDGVAIRQGLTALRAKLRDLPRVSKTSLRKVSEIDGYCKRSKKGKRYVIRCVAFNSLFASKTQSALVIEWLIKKRRITVATGKTSVGASCPKPQEQFVWPDGKRRRPLRSDRRAELGAQLRDDAHGSSTARCD